MKREQIGAEREAAVALAKRRLPDVIRKIEETGGWVVPGLYHGKRRVRANLDFENQVWVLKEDELDINRAVGQKSIDHRENRADLLQRTGLKIIDELAPVEARVTSSGRIELKRMDHWGDGAKVYIDNRSFWDKFRLYVPNYISFFILLLVPHFPIFDMLSKKISTKTGYIILLVWLILLIILGQHFENKGGSEFYRLFISIYLFFPAFMLVLNEEPEYSPFV